MLDHTQGGIKNKENKDFPTKGLVTGPEIQICFSPIFILPSLRADLSSARSVGGASRRSQNCDVTLSFTPERNPGTVPTVADVSH